MALMNRHLTGVETLFLPGRPGLRARLELAGEGGRALGRRRDRSRARRGARRPRRPPACRPLTPRPRANARDRCRRLDRAPAAGAAAGTGGRAGFRPDIEGLRAVAILTVLAYHAGLPVRGGFVGVDIFFVISGFLITGLLVAELDRSGSISWIRFVGRRIRRLLPAAVLVLVLISVVSWFVVPGLRRRDIGVDVAAAAMYVVNWVFARRETDYLASDVLPSPVQHFWSLAVEEQFYVIWPLLLIVLALRRAPPEPPRRRPRPRRPGRRRRSSWSVWFSHTSPRPAFFTTTTRVWELGIGALLAVALAGRPRPTTPAEGSAALGWAALVALRRRRALAAAGHRLARAPGRCCPPVPTAVLLWVGWQGVGARPGARARHRADGLGRCACRTRSTSGTGRSSSWAAGSPTAFGAHPARRGGWSCSPSPRCVPAWLSWRFVESPIHHGPWLRDRPRALLAAGLALSCVGVLAALPLFVLRSPFTTTPPGGALPPLSQLGAATLRPGQPFTAGRRPRLGHARPARLGRGPAEGRRRPLPGAGRRHRRRCACTFGDPQGTTTVALVGDSKAMQWLPALEEAAADPRLAGRHLRQVVVRLLRRPGGPGGRGLPASATRWNARGHGRPARRPARRRRHLRRRPPAPGPAAAPSASPLVDGYASRWTTPGGCRGAGRRRRRQPASRPTTSTCAPPGTRPS